MRCVRFLCVLSASLLTAAGAPIASAHDKPKPTPTPTGPVVICGTPVPNPGPFPPLPVPTGPVIVRDHRDPVIVRDHRDPTGPIIRDHRTPTGPIIRDHRTQSGVVVRDHRTTTTGTWKPAGSTGTVVTGGRTVDASQASGGVIVTQSPRRPIVRDHRKPTRKTGGNSIDLPGPLPNIPLPKLPISIPNPF
jgi:hypothetical protein